MTSPDVHRSYSFVSTVVSLPPRQAGVAYDFALSHLGLDGRLVVDGPLERAEPAGPYRALRSAPATLYVSRRARSGVPVRLELLPWSEGRTELALVPTSRRRAPVADRRLSAYGRAAGCTLTLFATLMLAPPPAWLEAILARDGAGRAQRPEVVALP